MKVKVASGVSIVELNVSIIDTNEFEMDWNGYSVCIRSQFTKEHIFVDEYNFIDECGTSIRGIRTTNCCQTLSYGAAADLIKRFALRNAYL